ncbi:MAG: ATP-binding protein [Treponema sp.]|nr:ATP-binding protein [Treponema sp.]
MKKNFFASNIVVLLFTFSFVIVFVVTVLASYFITYSMGTMDYNVHERIIAVSKILAKTISSEELDKYQKPEDMAIPSYKVLRYRLQVFALENNVGFAYFERPVDGKLQCIVDNDFDGETRDGLNTPPLDYSVSNPWIQRVLEGESECSSLGDYSLGWNGLMTAYSPVFDRYGMITAIAGVDIDDSSVVRSWKMVRFLTVVQIIAVIMVFISGFFSLIRYHREAEKAKAASVAKSSFLSRMSHEIRTPLNAIIGMGELALYSESMPKIMEYVGGIKQAGHNLLSLINDILDFSKIETGSLQIVKAPYYLASLLNDVINVVQVRLAERPILFTVNIDSGLPARLTGDEARVRQILFNLLSNAVKYTQQGTISLKVSAGLEWDKKEGDDLLLSMTVSDTGMGIKREDMVRLFSDFVRLDLVRNKSIEGSGLGLAITRSLCRAMGGDILVSSEYGRGTAFIVTIPQGRVDDEKLAVVEDPVTKSVLLYDHRDVYRDSLLETLGDLWVPATAAEDAGDFVIKLSSGKFAFAFVSAELLSQAQAVLRQDKSVQTVLVALAGIGEINVTEKMQVIHMPAHAVSVADILNGKGEELVNRKKPGINFITPATRILVVDDIPANLVVAEGLLAPYKARIDTCSSGTRALEQVKVQHYDLIFMDHMMPEMDGIEATRLIRLWEREKGQGKNGGAPEQAGIPIVALTANAVSGMREMFLEEGFNDYLSKPIDTVKLNEILKTWIPAEKRMSKAEEENTAEQAPLFGNTVIRGIDLKKGHERYRGKAYIDVLRAWCMHTPQLLEKLVDFVNGPFNGEALMDYTVTVHGLKGATYGICADSAAKKAETLEGAARQGDIPFIVANTGPFLDEVNLLHKSLEQLLANIAEQAEEKPLEKSPDNLLLSQLFEACKQYKSSVMEEILEKLEASRYESGGELIQWLREQMDNLEYDLIRERLEKQLVESK